MRVWSKFTKRRGTATNLKGRSVWVEWDDGQEFWASVGVLVFRVPCGRRVVTNAAYN
jgi:hypothetical protein